MQPRVAMISLMKKVNAKKKIIQDTGTGGAWPVSTDRAVWIIAAYEVYKATGDEKWLKTIYEIASLSMEDDIKSNWDATTGLFKGESSFLDWREQTYPKWMEPKDIYESKNLGTNAVFYQANMCLFEMAYLLSKPESGKYRSIAGSVKNGINRFLWMEDKGYYAQYLYGDYFQQTSPRAEALGEALCILFGIADDARARKIAASVPQTNFGISCIYPQIPGILPYHNNAVWPFVQSFWMQACAKAGNAKAVMESIASIYRPAALFATNKENFVADDGDFRGTQINSSIMLWSLSGNISIVHKVLFGLQFDADWLYFKPFVPKELEGRRSLKNFKYRKAILDIEMEGYGNRIKDFFIDGKASNKLFVEADIKGKHRIKIVLTNNEPITAINKVENYTTLPAPRVRLIAQQLLWPAVENAIKYRIYKNGILKDEVSVAGNYALTESNFTEYGVSAVDANGVESFISKPLQSIPSFITKEVEDYAPKADLPYKGFSEKGFVEISTEKNTRIDFNINIPKQGYYFVNFRYANGSGPLNTENKCAVRTLMVNNKQAGVMVFPQRGKDEWSIWGMSNAVKVFLPAGQNLLSLQYLPFNNNMNLDINRAMLDVMNLIPLTK